MIAVGWLLPGGGYLLTGRHGRFGLFFALICGLFAAGVALRGGYLWPHAEDLIGLDGFTIRVAQAGTLAKALAGAPYFIATLFGDAHNYAQGRIHEYGTTLLSVAGILNVLALLDARK
jgi:hypothetical protein